MKWEISGTHPVLQCTPEGKASLAVIRAATQEGKVSKEEASDWSWIRGEGAASRARARGAGGDDFVGAGWPPVKILSGTAELWMSRQACNTGRVSEQLAATPHGHGCMASGVIYGLAGLSPACSTRETQGSDWRNFATACSVRAAVSYLVLLPEQFQEKNGLVVAGRRCKRVCSADQQAAAACRDVGPEQRRRHGALGAGGRRGLQRSGRHRRQTVWRQRWSASCGAWWRWPACRSYQRRWRWPAGGAPGSRSRRSQARQGRRR